LRNFKSNGTSCPGYIPARSGRQL